MSSDFWQKAEKIARKVNGYVEKRYEATNAQYEAKKAEYHRILSTKTDDEIRRMKQNPNPNWNTLQKQLVDEEYSKRGL